MNDLTRDILTGLLKDPKNWDKKTGKPKCSTVRYYYLNAREYLWVEKVYFPRCFRACRLLKAMGWPDELFAWLEEDYASGWVIEDPALGDEFQRRLEPYFQGLWESPEWWAEDFTLEDLIALGVKPDPVPTGKVRRMLEHGQLQLL